MKVIYTALFGAHEELKEPLVITPGWNYICYTDQNITSDVWQIVKIDLFGASARRMARRIKIMEWVYWNKSIWIDASFTIAVNLDTWWNKYFAKGFSVPRHPQRHCVYDEIMACMMVNNENREKLLTQMEDYKNRHIAPMGGIITSGLIMRENKPEVIELCSKWWDELKKHTLRDQVAFAAVQTEFKDFINVYQWRYTDKKDFIYTKHFHLR